MSRTPRIGWLVLLIVLGSDGCKRNEPSQAQAAFDPIASFRRFSDAFVTNVRTGFIPVRKQFLNGQEPLHVEFTQYSIDVKKTDSLVHPYKGILTLNRTESNSTFTFARVDVVEFDGANGKWDLNSATEASRKHPDAPYRVSDADMIILEAASLAIKQ